MSISISIPAAASLGAEGVALNGHGGGGLGTNGVAGLLLTDSNAQSSASLPQIPRIASVSSSQVNPAVAASVSDGAALDALTPGSSTASGAAALSTVISSVSATISDLKTTIPPQLSELLQSPGFQLLFRVLSASEGAGTAQETAQTALNGNGNGASSAVPSTSYLGKLLGELQSTYQTGSTQGTTATSSSFNSPELDLFLRWISVHGQGSVAASA